jgi:small conductance mechanosensitive channel
MSEIESFLKVIHPNTVSGALIYAALFATLGVAGSLVIRHAAKRALRRDRVDHMAVVFLRPLGQTVLWVTLGVIYAHLIPELRALGTAMLAGASVASIVLGVAAQNTLGNAIAGLALLVYRPFRVGDRLQVQAPGGPETGVVESVSLGYTVLKTFDNRRVVLPNSLAGTQTTVNLTSVDPRVMTAVNVGISYTADVARAREILLDISSAHPDVIETVDCPVVELGSSSVSLRVRVWCRDQLASHRFEYGLYEQAKQRFAEAGIEIPYPYQNVVLTDRRADVLGG